MNTLHAFIRRFPRLAMAAAAPLALVAALAFSGCATRRQVSEIVAGSNAAMLAGQFGLPTARGEGQQPVWQQESDRIEAFIAAHSNQVAITAPLRLRQAMLLLGHRQIGLAKIAFSQAATNDLHTARDQALKRCEPTLLWWFANSTNDTWVGKDWENGLAALNQLKSEQESLSASPDIRDYLAEMRAWIGLSVARQRTNPARAREALVDALDVYAGIFTEADRAALAAALEPLPDPKALGPDVRRRLRARAVLDDAKEINARFRASGEPTAHPTTALCDQWINPDR